MPFRFSGHETFPFRYTWLPKAYRALKKNQYTFTDEEQAIVQLGVGKNMVRAIRFWIQVTGIAESADEGGYRVSDFGNAVLGTEGFDPYLEDVRTLWLIHWQLSTQAVEPLFAWDYLLNRWQHPDITRSPVLRAFRQEADRQDRILSDVTLEQHFDIFLHTYVPTRGRKGEIREDNLDCPLVELQLIQEIGERTTDKTGKRETLYAFRREAKPQISPELFIYCLNDFWKKHHVGEQSLTFRDIAISPGSPGQVFKLPEQDIRERLDHIRRDSDGVFDYHESAALQQVTRHVPASLDFLSGIYRTEDNYV